MEIDEGLERCDYLAGVECYHGLDPNDWVRMEDRPDAEDAALSVALLMRAEDPTDWPLIDQDHVDVSVMDHTGAIQRFAVIASLSWGYRVQAQGGRDE